MAKTEVYTIYIAASWKHRHAVEMLTSMLRAVGFEVRSFVEKATEAEGRNLVKFDIDGWIASADGKNKFEYDTQSAMTSDAVIYIAPSGKDAIAECGAAWAKKVPLLGLYAKGEDLGLMRRMFDWCDDVWQLFNKLGKLFPDANGESLFQGKEGA